MTIGPEPTSRILWRSVFLGMGVGRLADDVQTSNAEGRRQPTPPGWEANKTRNSQPSVRICLALFSLTSEGGSHGGRRSGNTENGLRGSFVGENRHGSGSSITKKSSVTSVSSVRASPVGARETVKRL